MAFLIYSEINIGVLFSMYFDIKQMIYCTCTDLLAQGTVPSDHQLKALL